MNNKIVRTIFIAFVISFTTLYVVNDLFRNDFDRMRWVDLFYSQEFDPNEKRMYLLGSIFVLHINQTYIEEFL